MQFITRPVSVNRSDGVCIVQNIQKNSKELSSCCYASEMQIDASQVNAHMKELHWQRVHPCCTVEVR